MTLIARLVLLAAGLLLSIERGKPTFFFSRQDAKNLSM